MPEKHKSVVISCEGKEAFATYALASQVLKRAKVKKQGGSVYHCEFCHQYHIGSKPSFIKKSKSNPRYRETT